MIYFICMYVYKSNSIIHLQNKYWYKTNVNIVKYVPVVFADFQFMTVSFIVIHVIVHDQEEDTKHPLGET